MFGNMENLFRPIINPPVREGVLGLFKKKKHKKKKSSPTPSPTTTTNVTTCPDPPPPLQYPNPTAADQAAVYNSQLSTYSSTISDCNTQSSNLARELAECRVELKNEKEQDKLRLKRQKEKYLGELSDQEKMYLKELKEQEIRLDKIIKQLQNQIKKLKQELNARNSVIQTKEKTILQYDQTRIDLETEIEFLESELRAMTISKDKCVSEAIAAGKRFGYPRARVESNIYNSQINDIFNDISQDMDTMQKQNLYAYTLKDHIRKIKKELQIVNEQIELYKDKVHLNQRKSFYEQQEVNMEQGWEIGLHIIYASIFLGIIVYLCITKDPITNTPKVTKPKNIAILIFLLLYPMLIYPVTKSVYDGINYGIKNLPKDIYMNI
jgi:hypothetical protein